MGILMLRKAFTMVELIVVVGIISILIALIIPAVMQIRAAADRTSCQNNLRQIGVALHHYHADNGRLPPLPADSSPLAFLSSKDPNVSLGWMALLLPYIEQDALWAKTVQAFRQDSVIHHNPPHVAYSAIIPLYICPADNRLKEPLIPTRRARFTSFASYMGVSGKLEFTKMLPGVLGNAPGMRLSDIKDGTSNTVMAGERPPPNSLQAGQWYSWWGTSELNGGPDIAMTIPGFSGNFFDNACPNVDGNFGPGSLDNPCDRFHFWSLHPGNANFLFADTSVRAISYSARSIMPALASHSGGEVVEIP